MADLSWWNNIYQELTDDQAATMLEQYNLTWAEEYALHVEAPASLSAKRLEMAICLQHNLMKVGGWAEKEIEWRCDKGQPGSHKWRTPEGHDRWGAYRYGYALYWRGQIVYVGITYNPKNRMKGHAKEKTFDGMIVWARSSPWGIEEWEKDAIAEYLPILNRRVYDWSGRWFSSSDYMHMRQILMQDNPDLWETPATA